MRTIETSEGRMLGIPTGLSPRSFSGIDTVELKKSRGIIVNPGGPTEDWEIMKFMEQKGEMVAAGPWQEGIRPWNPVNDGPAILETVLHGIKALKAAGYPLGGLYLPAIQVLEGGKILILPPRLEAWIRDNSSDEMKSGDWDAWNHPDLEGEEAWSFALGMVAWRMLTGEDPARNEQNEERRERIRSGILPSIASVDGRLTEDTVKVIDGALKPGKGRRTGLEDWAKLISRWKTGDIRRNLSDSEAAAARGKAARSSEPGEKQLRFRRWIRRSLWKYALAAAILGGIAAFTVPPISKALEKPVTVGMSPMEVAETYYDAIDRQDSEIMDDCLARNVGKPDKQFVDMMYVTNKVRQGYEGLQAPPRASDWLAEGRPELPEGQWPWGITELVLEELPDGRIVAAYLFWSPGRDVPLSEARGERREDILTFTEGRRSWEISNIGRSSEYDGS